jgi:hypothetical protein
MMYAGIDVDANPDYAFAATNNEHLSLADRVAHLEAVLDVDQLPKEFADDGFFNVQKRFPPTSNTKAADVSIYFEPFFRN